MNLDPNVDTCPCESGLLLKDCCLKNGRLDPTPVRLVRPSGGEKHASCYAAALKGCSTKISLEHHLSHALLKQLADAEGKVTVEGYSWQEEGESDKAAVKKLGSKTLCTEHNAALSTLDIVGTRFFEELTSIGADFRVGNGVVPDRVLLLSGFDLERWFLKFLIGSAASVLPEGGRDWRPPDRWLKILFDGTEFEAGVGLWLVSEVGSIADDKASVSFASISDEQSREIVGLVAQMRGFHFVLSMKDGVVSKGVFRPGELAFESPQGAKRMIKLGWPRPDGEQAVKIDWQPPKV